MKSLHKVAFCLLIIGGLNWLLVAFGFDLVQKLLGSWPMVVKVIYILVGAAAILEVVTHKSNCRFCLSPQSGSQQM